MHLQLVKFTIMIPITINLCDFVPPLICLSFLHSRYRIFAYIPTKAIFGFLKYKYLSCRLLLKCNETCSLIHAKTELLSSRIY